MPDVLDDELAIVQVMDMSSGQWSFQYSGDTIVIPQNAGSEMLDMEIDKIGQRGKRRGYTLIADDLGSVAIVGLIDFNPAGGSKRLVSESNGVVYSWDGAASTWSSSQTGLTAPSDWTHFVVGNGRLFRLSQTENVQSTTDLSSWTDEGNTNSDFPRAKFAIWTSNQRMLAFNTTTEPGGGYYSDAGAPQTYDRTSNLFRFGKKDTDGVTGAIEFTANAIMVFTKDTMDLWDISNATPGNWTRQRVADLGCEAFRTVRLIGEDALFLSRDGVRSILQSAQDKKRGASLPLSFPIKDWIDRINWEHAGKSVAWVWNDKYYLSVPIDASTTNSHTLVWSRRAFEANQKRGGWTVWTNTGFNAYAIQTFSQKPRLYSGEGSADGKVYQLRSANPDDDTKTDNGTAITLSETGKRLDFGARHLIKTFRWVEVQALSSDATNLTVQAQVDGGGYSTVGTMDLSDTLPTLPQTLPFNLGGTNRAVKKFSLTNLGRGHDVQVKITEDTSGADAEILGYTVAAYLENVGFDTV